MDVVASHCISSATAQMPLIVAAHAHAKKKKQRADLNNQDIPIVPFLEHVNCNDEGDMNQL